MLYFLNARKNGTIVGTVFKDVKGPLFPTVAVHSQNEEYVDVSLLSVPCICYFIYCSSHVNYGWQNLSLQMSCFRSSYYTDIGFSFFSFLVWGYASGLLSSEILIR